MVQTPEANFLTFMSALGHGRRIGPEKMGSPEGAALWRGSGARSPSRRRLHVALDFRLEIADFRWRGLRQDQGRLGLNPYALAQKGGELAHGARDGDDGGGVADPHNAAGLALAKDGVTGAKVEGAHNVT